MQTWSSIYRHQRKQLRRFQLPEGSEGSDPSIQFIYTHPLLLRSWFLFKTFVFLIDLYYLNQCCLWLAFRSFYEYSLDQLLPLNVVLLTVLLLHLCSKVLMTPRLPGSMVELLGKSSRWLLYGEHLLRYDRNWVSLLVFVCFLGSYLIGYPAAAWLHLAYTLKLVDMNSYLAVVHTKIHTYKALRVAYRLAMLMFIILYLSNIFAAAFYYMDQRLIELQYFGDPQTNPQVYYQFNSASFTPIEMLSEFQRYIMAFYFSNGLVSTIAYGDIVGQNYIEDIYVTILMVVSTVMVAFLLEEFMIMVEDNRFAIYDIIKDFGHLEQLMRQKSVPSGLQLSIRNYIFYIEYYDKFQNPNTILQKLTHKMRADLFRKGYGPHLEPLLRPLALPNFDALYRHIQEVIYQPEVDLFLPYWKRIAGNSRQCACESETFQPNFLYLTKGKVYQYLQWQFESARFQLREELSHINAFEFFSQTNVRYGVRTKSIVHFIRITYDSLREVLEQEPSSKKSLRRVRQGVLSNCLSRKLLLDNCEVCDEDDHNAINCPSAHIVVDSSVCRAIKVESVLSNRVNRNQRKQRKRTISSKQINLRHFSALLANLSLTAPPEQREEGPGDLSMGVNYLEKTIKNLFERVKMEEGRQWQNSRLFCDSTYDPQGIQEEYRLDHA